ncbi:hypothetical protein CMO93_02460 [Candidatus Woesearchaeota archaeon]|nr:hypothetical protein [Candidatus Woesearchaeota archaeon]|tara:strand:+ start:2117 stop:4015 length:1899 start_codon:yes stop_codon:yes gene_type:complete
MKNEKIAALLILFFIFAYSVSSLKTFEINETEKISLAPKVEDPDADMLIYIFTEPLDENGEWQTTYGDSGEYNAVITVSDGVNEVSEEVLIIVNRNEAAPNIDDFEPEEELVIIDEGNSIKFTLEASDLNNDELKYEWSINNDFVSDNNEFLFDTGYEDAGVYVIDVVIRDGIFNISKKWNIKVNDVELDSLLEQIKDVAVIETETASLDLPDFEQYGLSYSISEPIGNDNEWETGYDDAGEYEVIISVEGKDFEEEEEIKVIVDNKDRPPKFVGLRDTFVKENEVLNINLEAIDPDNDEVFFSVENIPKGANLDENVFTWTPGYDFVQKEEAFDYVLDKFRVFSKSINVKFIAQSNKLIDEKNIRVRVKDANRPFVLEDIDDIEVNEGEEIIIDPKYNDPDNDKVSFSYSGFMGKNKKQTGFDDSGAYIVKVVANDGVFTETIFVNIVVNDVNRKPVFDTIRDYEVIEGNGVRIELSADDPDNDELSYSVVSLPENAKLRDNVFTWKPDYDFVLNGTQKDLWIEFIVNDGAEESRQTAIIKVFNKNRAPEIADFSDNLVVFKDEPTLFEVNAVDEDGNELKYEWDFGFLEKFENDENKHQRTFTTTGSKEVTVTVSDGKESVSKVWNVEVV